ncbi:hypothetical protein BHAOGJBA_1202 [Methylobacterium hispanicum]|uniref:Uncharacterized protein n=2 Tax=Methylobacterium hispanicum TaxID=270350 RepID=A0AAV4ZH37_9HYPH|nr:hypothetical protein BHAOGJBA_1202 [Methylobacterium hispanicum]
MPMFEVPFAYTAQTVALGKRKLVPTTLMSSVMVEVASVSAEEAPLVLRWHRYNWGREDELQPPFDYRLHGGDLFLPVYYEYSGRPDHHVDLSEAVAAAGQGYRGKFNPLAAGEEFHRIPADARRRARDVDGIMTIRSSDEDEIAARIRGKAADLIAVDGLLFRRTQDAEPIYDLSNGHLKTVKLGSVKPDHRDVRTHFRVDQIPEVLEVLGAFEGQDEGSAEIDLDDPATYRGRFREFVEVFDAGVLRYQPDQGPKLLAYAASLVAREKDGIADAPVATMVAYAAVRDAVKAGVAADEICSLLEHYAEVLAAGAAADGPHWRQRQIVAETTTYRMSPINEREPAADAGPRP